MNERPRGDLPPEDRGWKTAIYRDLTPIVIVLIVVLTILTALCMVASNDGCEVRNGVAWCDAGERPR